MMKVNCAPFCTCTDTACPNHPTNHSEGCSRCVRKCLALGEIPSCFFKEVDPGYKGPGYTYADFAAAVKGGGKCEE